MHRLKRYPCVSRVVLRVVLPEELVSLLGLGGVHDFVELVPPNASPPEAPRVNHRASQGWKRPLTSERLVRLTNAGRKWATEQLDALLGHTEFYRRPDPPGVVNFISQLSTRGRNTTLWPALRW